MGAKNTNSESLRERQCDREDKGLPKVNSRVIEERQSVLWRAGRRTVEHLDAECIISGINLIRDVDLVMVCDIKIGQPSLRRVSAGMPKCCRDDTLVA